MGMGFTQQQKRRCSASPVLDGEVGAMLICYCCIASWGMDHDVSEHSRHCFPLRRARLGHCQAVDQCRRLSFTDRSQCPTLMPPRVLCACARRRDTRLLDALRFVHGPLWKYLFGRTARDLEQSNNVSRVSPKLFSRVAVLLLCAEDAACAADRMMEDLRMQHAGSSCGLVGRVRLPALNRLDSEPYGCDEAGRMSALQSQPLSDRHSAQMGHYFALRRRRTST